MPIKNSELLKEARMRAEEKRKDTRFRLWEFVAFGDLDKVMHDSCDGKFCFQVTAEIFRNCSRNEDGTIYLIDDADDKTVKKIASARSSLNPKKVRAELHRLKSWQERLCRK